MPIKLDRCDKDALLTKLDDPKYAERAMQKEENKGGAKRKPAAFAKAAG